MLDSSSNPGFRSDLNLWIKDYMWPHNDSTTRVGAGLLLPQEQGANGNLNTYLCGRGLFQVFGTYDQQRNRITKGSIHFAVPYFKNIELASGFTGSLNSPFRIPVRYKSIKGYIELFRRETEILMKYELETFLNLSDTVSLFPTDYSALAAKAWYKDVPLMEESTVTLLTATPDSPVNVFNATSKHGYNYAELNNNSPDDQQDELLKKFIDEFADGDKIVIPATPQHVGSSDHLAKRAVPREQHTVRVRFLSIFEMNGSINLNNLFINALLLIFIPFAGSTHTCKIAGIVKGDGVEVTLNEPLIKGSVNIHCDPTSQEKTVAITLQLEVALTGPVTQTDFPLFSIS